MPFKKTFELIHEYNTNPSAILPNPYDIINNSYFSLEEIILSPECKENVKDIYCYECKENNENNIYFFGCEAQVYLNSYEERFRRYKEWYVDAEEIDFIKSELSIGILDIRFPFISDRCRYKIHYSLKKRFNFLRDRLNFLGFDLIFKSGITEPTFHTTSCEITFHKRDNYKKEANLNSCLNWQDSPTDLVELIKGLALKKSFGNISEKEIAEKFESFFNFKINDYESTKNKIRGRKKDLTSFFNDVIYGIEKWRKDLDNKKENDNQRMNQQK